MGNSVKGKIIKISSFGESHGKGIGILIDGLPAGLVIDKSYIQNQLYRRRPGQSDITTKRNEEDNYEILSGVYDGKSTGSPLTFFIKNKDLKSADYYKLHDVFRPSHADFTYHKKYGIRDYRGGGRSSARITAGWVLAGSICELYLREVSKIQICAFVSQIGSIKMDQYQENINRELVDQSIVRCPDQNIANEMIDLITQVKNNKDSVGGIITCIVKNMPIGLGEPVFNKLSAELAHSMFSINAVKGFEIGEGFAASGKYGSQINDGFVNTKETIKTITNFSGGIQGGISNGSDLIFKVAFKATATIGKKQKTVNEKGESVELETTGRHDPCVVPRAVPIVEAMCAHVLADMFLLNKLSKL